MYSIPPVQHTYQRWNLVAGGLFCLMTTWQAVTAITEVSAWKVVAQVVILALVAALGIWCIPNHPNAPAWFLPRAFFTAAILATASAAVDGDYLAAIVGLIMTVVLSVLFADKRWNALLRHTPSTTSAL